MTVLVPVARQALAFGFACHVKKRPGLGSLYLYRIGMGMTMESLMSCLGICLPGSSDHRGTGLDKSD